MCNIFLHELDTMMVKELGANRPQTQKERDARVSKEYRRIGNRLWVVRQKLKAADHSERQQLLTELVELEKVQKRTPVYESDRRHPCKLGYVRYADDFVILVNGSKEEAEAMKAQVADKLTSMGLKLSEEKTKLTHWSQPVRFLGFDVQGRMRDKGVQIKAIFSIPADKCERIRQEIQQVCGCHQIPEADAMARVSQVFRGWCNYYRFASGPQNTFSRLSYFAWWQFARFLAYRHKTSVAEVIRCGKRSNRLRPITIQGRRVQTFTMDVGGKELVLNIVPPKTGSIWNLPKPMIWDGDKLPLPMTSWALGRSLETRLTAIGRADGLCEGCGRNPVFQVHHPRPMTGKSFKAKVASDSAQRSRGIALCRECHATAHGRTLRKKQESSGNAGCAERCPSGVGRAV